MKIPRSAEQLNSVISHQAVVFLLLLFFIFFWGGGWLLQVVREFPLIQAAFQGFQTHRGAGGNAAKCPAQKARSPSHGYHQHAGGEPRRRRRDGFGAEVGGQGPRTEAQGGP